MGASRVAFTVPGEAVPWKAPRVVRRGAHHVAISPRAMKNAQATVQSFAWKAMQDAGAEPITGPVRLMIIVFKAKGMPTSVVGRTAAEMDALRPTKGWDASNVAKSTEDALSGICFIDDSQVVELHVEKRFSERPRIEIVVQPWRPSMETIGNLSIRGLAFTRWLNKWYPSDS